ncbi:OmpH family outer membrane protein [Hymenobacter actinosclerus]|uniref:Periplasmic chaperone for outer membrane proteins Skp n=1 Tax=Hymenobacter actinosclerus TaxID=82805 RepID=A0A1I0A7A6_9BACT|nr:OmpH family outer membrane protein [Hymenobacter actinosclerus]SES90008.1 periplasmic chaperone for outer membrane proteins Skp [Hymenobacter actinosclerus]
MKNSTQLIVNAVLVVAVAVLFYLHFASGKPAKPAASPAPVAATPADTAATEPEPEVALTPAVLADTNKVAYVETNRLLEEYQGMKDASKRLEAKARGWEAQNKKLVTSFQTAVQQYQQKAEGMSAEQRAATEQQLQAQQMKVGQEQERLQRQAQEEQGKLNEQVMGRVNKQIEKYGKTNGYRLILATGAGNIAYGRKDLDITTPVLKYLNSEYGGKK